MEIKTRIAVAKERRLFSTVWIWKWGGGWWSVMCGADCHTGIWTRALWTGDWTRTVAFEKLVLINMGRLKCVDRVRGIPTRMKENQMGRENRKHVSTTLGEKDSLQKETGLGSVVGTRMVTICCNSNDLTW